MDKKEQAVKKAQEAVNRLKEIEQGQLKVVELFKLADEQENKLEAKVKAFQGSKEYLDARNQGNETFRNACLSATQALADKIFATQIEMANKLGYDENKMSRIVKCGKVFAKYTHDALGKQKDRNGVALDELAVKRIAHQDGKFLTMLLKDEAELSQIANARADRQATEATDASKLKKAIAKVVKLIENGDIPKAEITLQYRAVKSAYAKKCPDAMKSETMEIIRHYEASLKQGQKVKA